MALAEEMIEEILMKIPSAGYVWDMRRVCKSWNSLITQPRFASKHLERNKNNSCFLLLAFCQRLARKSISLFRLNHPLHTLVDMNPMAARKLDYFYSHNNFKDFFKELVVAGSINGIVCVSSFYNSVTRYLALWNPAINRWKPIPVLPREKEDDKYSSVGLGYDSFTNDYRIIRLVSVVTGDDTEPPSSRIEIYSVNQDSWIPDEEAASSVIPYFTTQPNCSVIVKGIPYWSRNYELYNDYWYTRMQSDVIATVDPHTGLYKEISYPDIVTDNENTTVHPFNFMDSLAVLIYEDSNPKMFYVYAHSHDDANWIHLYTSAPTILQTTDMCILRCFQDAGKIIVVGCNYDDCRRSFLYDLQTDSLCHSIGMDALRPRWDETYYHVESLVCLDGMEPIQREEDSNNNQLSGEIYIGRDICSVEKLLLAGQNYLA